MASLTAFLRWWLGQLSGLFPASWRAASRAAPDGVVVRREGGILVGWQRRGGRLRSLGPIRSTAASQREGAASTACLAVGDHLAKRIGLPPSARPSLAQLLSFEIERETPFAAEEVYWGFADRGLDRAGRLQVDLLLVPRAAVDPDLQAIRDAGLRPLAVEVADAEGPVWLPTVPAGRRAGPQATTRLRPLLAIACVAAALVALGLPVLRSGALLEALRAEVEAARTEAELAGQLRRRLAANDELLAAAQGYGHDPTAALTALAALTDAVPDDAYLLRLTLREGRLELAATAVSADTLLQKWPTAGPLGEPTLAAPIALAGRTGREDLALILRPALLAP